MQQAVMEGGENEAYEPPAPTYDEVFPALPELAASAQPNPSTLGQWNQKMRIGSSVVTQVFRVPYEERKFDHSDKFGEGDPTKCCSEIMKDTGAHIEISSAKDQSLTFLVTGKQDSVLEARRKILSNFQTQASVNISIPKEHHRYILGKSGAKLQELEKVTATKISVPKATDTSEKITITGPKEGIDKAVHEMRVISDEQSKQAYERLPILKIYHPFIAGAHNEKLNSLINETGVRINIPPPSVHKDEITIAGEKEGVMKAKERVVQISQEMEKKCSTVCVEVSKAQHKYVVGPRGNTIAEILQQTGVSVEMPPNDSSTETITLRGPQDKLGLALTMVYAKANSIVTRMVEAPSWIHKYIIGKKGANIRQITQDLNKVHVEFTEKEDKIRIEGPPEEVEPAQKALDEMAADLISRLTFDEISVDPKFHKHIIGKSGANVNRLKEETGVLINISENEGVSVIRLEGSVTGVKQAKKEMLDMVEKLENEKEKDIIIDHRFFKNIIGSKGDNIREIREKFNQVQITFPGPNEKRDVVKIRGPKEDVDLCYKHLQKLHKSLMESSHMIEVPIFKQFHKFIIGKAGGNIRKIRDETQTKIDLPAEVADSDVIVITGKKENAEDARDRILKIQNELANIVSEDIIIPSKFHNSLIGSGGKLIQSVMEDCGGVAIKFPQAESNSDKVTVRGPKDDVEKAKKMLLELSSERQLANYSVEVRAKPQHHKFLIGRSGANIKKIRDATGARIIFPSDKDEQRDVITIIGRKEAVDKAKIELEATIKEVDKIVEEEMHVDPKHHRHFVARRGEVLREIGAQYGGVMVSFPRSGDTSDRVVLKGAKECIDGARQRIEEIVRDLEQKITIECVIPQKYHRTVMGAKGSKVQGITFDFDVQIKFPDRDTQDSNYGGGGEEDQMNGDVNIEPRQADIIRITGKPDNCEAAKAALLGLVPVTIKVNMPFDFHRSIIGQKGREVREMMERYDVNIALPPAEQKLDVIQVSGTPANVERARQALEERSSQLEAERQDRIARSHELVIDVDPEHHPKIIGRKGGVISKIREDHNVQITFPKKDDPDENKITITGYEENTYAAKEAIMKIVNELNDRVKEEITIDSRVHPRLIGAKGRNIRRLMEEFKVDIKFPRANDPDPNLVVVMGAEDSVYDAVEHLQNAAEEYMQDVHEAEVRKEFSRNMSQRSDDEAPSRGGDNHGFVVKGAPWEHPQSAPNTASTEDFPTFGEAPAAPSMPGPWGPRR